MAISLDAECERLRTAGYTDDEISWILTARPTFWDDIRQLIAASGLPVVYRSIVNNIWLSSAVAYVYATIFGLIHSVVFYNRTAINPFDFYGLNDFLMSALRHPVGLLVAGLAPVFVTAGTLVSVLLCTLLLQLRRFVASMRSISDDDKLKFKIKIALIQKKTYKYISLYYYGCLILYTVFGMIVMSNMSINIIDDDECYPVMKISIKGDGNNKRDDIERIIVDSTEKVIFVMESKAGGYGAIFLDTVSAITPVPGNTAGKSFKCFLAH